jgi:hypothetical protein
MPSHTSESYSKGNIVFNLVLLGAIIVYRIMLL